MDHTRKKAISMLQSNEYKFDQAVTKSATFSAIDPLNVPTQLVKNTISDNTLKTTTESLPFSIVIGKKDTDQIYLDKVPVLFQNYPNPFNPTTRIKYEISRSRNVILKVYNILGKEISILINQRQNPGNYQITFDAHNLPSGIYFYELTIDNTSRIVKKMILIK